MGVRVRMGRSKVCNGCGRGPTPHADVSCDGEAGREEGKYKKKRDAGDVVRQRGGG